MSKEGPWRELFSYENEIERLEVHQFVGIPWKRELRVALTEKTTMPMPNDQVVLAENEADLLAQALRDAGYGLELPGKPEAASEAEAMDYLRNQLDKAQEATDKRAYLLAGFITGANSRIIESPTVPPNVTLAHEVLRAMREWGWLQ